MKKYQIVSIKEDTSKKLLYVKSRQQKRHLISQMPFLILAVPIFPGRHQPSIFGVTDFTSVFGMGTGVSL